MSGRAACTFGGSILTIRFDVTLGSFWAVITQLTFCYKSYIFIWAQICQQHRRAQSYFSREPHGRLREGGMGSSRRWVSGQSTDLNMFGSMEGSTTLLTVFFPSKVLPVQEAIMPMQKTFLPKHTRDQSHVLYLINLVGVGEGGCRPSAALSTCRDTKWLLPPKSPVHLCKRPLPSAP